MINNEPEPKSNRNVDEPRLNRRRLLKNSGGIFTVGAITDITPANSSEDKPSGETTKIPFLKRGEEVVQWIEVSIAWENHRKEAKDTLDEFRALYSKKKGVANTGL